MGIQEKMKTFLHDSFVTEQVFKQNEIQANSLVALAMLMNLGLLVISWLLNALGVFAESSTRMNALLLRALPEMLIPALLCYHWKGSKPWLKYVLMVEFTVVLARVDSVMGYNSVLLMVVPVVLSIRYYSKQFTAQISLLTTILFSVSAFCGAYLDMAPLDLNYYFPAPGTVLKVETYLETAVYAAGIDPMERALRYMTLAFLPKLLFFTLIAIVSARIAKKGHDMVLEHDATMKQTTRMETELNLASGIQSSMLPSLFPPFPKHDEFQIYATMDPAKEVGGDFYDFFMPNDRTLAVVAADVSGKGVPASLFMVISKALIKNQATSGISPAEVFTKVNNMLCEGNDMALFVTAWMGVLDLDTGILTYVNAGHTPPFLKTADGSFTRLTAKPALVLAGMEDTVYTQKELQLSPGDRLFLYTDGVTEAVNPAMEQFGEARLQAYLNSHAAEAPEPLLHGLKAALDDYADTAEQFDDITMLILDYCKSPQWIKERFPAKLDSLDQVIGFVEENVSCDPKTAMQLSLVTEEVFVNIASYAYPETGGDMTLALRMEPDALSMVFTDWGLPFDPTTAAPAADAVSGDQVGGLGILMVRKIMDTCSYQRKDGQNVLTLKKKL